MQIRANFSSDLCHIGRSRRMVVAVDAMIVIRSLAKWTFMQSSVRQVLRRVLHITTLSSNALIALRHTAQSLQPHKITNNHLYFPVHDQGRHSPPQHSFRDGDEGQPPVAFRLSVFPPSYSAAKKPSRSLPISTPQSASTAATTRSGSGISMTSGTST